MALEPDDIKALIAILQKGLQDDDDDSSTPQAKTTRKTSTRKPKPKSKNKFETMSEFNMCKEDLEFDRKVRKPPPSARNREFDYVKVQCRVCGKKDKVAPSLVESIERYKCNKCSTGAG
jgi:hypothetical protein